MERKTAQRESIRRVLAAAAGPLGPQEVHAAAHAKLPGLGLATVYRTIKAGLAEGWLCAVELPGEPPRYEVARRDSRQAAEAETEDHHHHFECRGCGRVFCLDGCPGRFEKLLPAGFALESHDVVLYGLCESCNRAA